MLTCPSSPASPLGVCKSGFLIQMNTEKGKGEWSRHGADVNLSDQSCMLHLWPFVAVVPKYRFQDSEYKHRPSFQIKKTGDLRSPPNMQNLFFCCSASLSLHSMDANVQVFRRDFRVCKSEFWATEDAESNVMNFLCLELWERGYFVSHFFSR